MHLLARRSETTRILVDAASHTTRELSARHNRSNTVTLLDNGVCANRDDTVDSFFNFIASYYNLTQPRDYRETFSPQKTSQCLLSTCLATRSWTF
jgi:hypothetical protein